ncbi:WhiB family transcriptional regulator [Streptomyces sp. NBC_01233]|uniref:WhiB family transcriptional regulator n=1 Tax=Streptomyces sp. NBC_01233 TaxID=2903787 RepID=UPI002E0EAA07|nr:WhiB family transcriptional regulator [Streptomyces sp. NBC_01233]
MTTSIYTRRFGRALSAVPGSVSTAETEPDWRDLASCLDLGALFLPKKEFGPESAARTTAAKKICARCPVLDTCLDNAMTTEYGYVENGRAGVRGGLTPQERAARYKRQRRKVPEPLTLIDQYLRRTEALDDGHVRWTVNTSYITFEGRQYTGAQLAWAVSTNRKPQGILRTACGLAGCVAAEHLTDEVMRDANNRYRSRQTA